MRKAFRVVLPIVTAVCALAAPALASFSGTDVFIPSLGSGPGASSSQWNACIWVHNPNSSPVNVTFRLLLRDQPNPSPQVYNATIPAGDTRRYDNAFATLFGATGKTFGAVRVTTPAGQPVIVNARSYSTPAGGEQMDTAGQFYAAVPASFAIGPGQTTELLGAYQTTPQANSEFRYNYGFVETTGNAVTVQVTALDETGMSVGSKSYTLGGYQASQYNITDLLPAVSTTDLRLEVAVTSGPGQVVAFGSGIANRSNDPSTFEMSFRDQLLAANSPGGGLTAVSHDGTLTGDGTTATPLGIATGGVGKTKLAASGGTNGQVLGTDGTNLLWQTAAGLTLPYSGTASSTNAVFVANNTGSGGAIEGDSNATTASVTGFNYSTGWGVYGRSSGGDAVVGLSSGGGSGVYGQCNTCYGVYGVSVSLVGVTGTSTTSNGVLGSSTSGDGVAGLSGNWGVYGKGGNASGAWGVLGTMNEGVAGISGKGATGAAGYFDGYVTITGTISKGGGSFKIDHPLDPEHKYLYHSFVESPDMKNIYDGVVTTDADGRAVVQLPEWFGALNRDFRYQLTVIGRFAQAIVEQEIENNRFAIRTNLAQVKVSWQVTGIRKDPFANANRIPVEEVKPAAEQGSYLHPAAWGQPEEKSVTWARDPEMMRRMKEERAALERQKPSM